MPTDSSWSIFFVSYAEVRTARSFDSIFPSKYAIITKNWKKSPQLNLMVGTSGVDDWDYREHQQSVYMYFDINCT